MHRIAHLSLFALLPLAGGASIAQAEMNLEFQNMTAVEVDTVNFSVDVAITGMTETLAGFQFDYSTVGMNLDSVDSLTVIDYLVVNPDQQRIMAMSISNHLEPLDDPEDPLALVRLHLEITETSGPISITLDQLLFITPTGQHMSGFGQDSYTFTIPAPATFALLLGAMPGIRRRRAG